MNKIRNNKRAKHEYQVLLTCPAMINRLDEYQTTLNQFGFELTVPYGLKQVLSEEQLIKLLPDYDAWIIGDDPATRRVLEAGRKGKLRVCVKWGVGVDNVDFQACKDLKIPIDNTPGMFGDEVADVAIGYMVNLARHLHLIDSQVRNNVWYKPTGISLRGKHVCLLGFGDIGRKIALRLFGFQMQISVCDPGFTKEDDQIKCLYNPELEIEGKEVLENIVKEFITLGDSLPSADFLIVCCNLNQSTHHLVGDELLKLAKPGLRLINVSRGPIVREDALIRALKSGQVQSAALDVFEVEPLSADSELRNQEFKERTIFGTHNSSNTGEAVDQTSHLVLQKLYKMLNKPKF